MDEDFEELALRVENLTKLYRGVQAYIDNDLQLQEAQTNLNHLFNGYLNHLSATLYGRNNLSAMVIEGEI